MVLTRDNLRREATAARREDFEKNPAAVPNVAPAENDRRDGRSRTQRQATRKRTGVTDGPLDRVWRSLGFSCRLTTLETPARVYEDKA